MDTLAIQPDSSACEIIRVAPFAVYVNGRRRRDLYVRRWALLPAPEFGWATVTLGASGQDRPERRFQDVAALPAIGSRLEVRRPAPACACVFEGRVARHASQVSPDAEELTAEAEDSLRTRLTGAVSGRWQVSGGGAVFALDSPCVFNDAEGTASGSAYALNGRSCRVFEIGSTRLWSVADMLEYLLAAHVPADVGVSGLEEVRAIAEEVRPGRVSVSGLSAAEALAKVALLAGLEVRGGICSDGGRVTRGLVFYRPGRTGRRRAVRLQPAGQVLDVRQSNLWQGRIVFGKRPARRGVLVLGDLKRYESTFALQPGWDPALESYEHHVFVRSQSPDFRGVEDVFRKWVLNEDGSYSGPPYDLPTFDLGALSEDFFLKVPRRFLPCLSLDGAGRSLGVVVEVSYDDGEHWSRYGGPIRLSGDECAILLGDDALPAEYFQAAVNHAVQVRVTATVVSDRRLSAQALGDAGAGVEVVQVPRARWAKVHPTSVFYQDPALPSPDEQDDTARLIQLARNVSESQTGAIEAELTLGRLDATFSVGDIVECVQGRGLSLGSFPGARAHVRRVEHRCGEDWTTVLALRG